MEYIEGGFYMKRGKCVSQIPVKEKSSSRDYLDTLNVKVTHK